MTSAAALSYLRDFVRTRSAIVLTDDKDYLLESRLGPVANDAGSDGLDGLAEKLRQGRDTALATSVVEALTTNETYFFRDKHPFETLRTVVLPELIAARRPKKTLRIWCAAASTGQEPYTIAMIVAGLLGHQPDWEVEILATDINQTVLDRAAEGIYRQHEVNRGLPTPLLVRHFQRAGTNWQLKEAIRGMVTFQRLNLLDPWPVRGPLDIVFLRNVLIYFDREVKHDLLDRVHRLLPADGSLFLGGAETTINLHDGYQSLRSGPTTLYKTR